MCHEVLVLTHDAILAERLISSLPFNRNLGQIDGGVQNGNKDKEEEEDDEEDGKRAPLSAGKIAWQYDKYIQASVNGGGPALTSNSLYRSLGGVNSFGCSFDLSRRLQPHILQSNPIQCFSAPHATSLAEALDAYAAAAAAFLEGIAQRKCTGQSAGVARIFVPRLDCWLDAFDCDVDGKCAGTSELAARCKLIVSFTLKLKHLIRSTSTVLCLSVLPEAAPRLLLSGLVGLHDTALAVETFAGRESSIPREFHEFTGFFRVDKLQHVGCVVPPSAAAFAAQYGLKRDRRKLHICPLHLPPAESRAFGDAGSDAALERKSERMAGGLNDLAYSLGPSKMIVGSSTLQAAAAPAVVVVSQAAAPTASASAAPLSLAEKLAMARLERQGGARGAAVSISSFRPSAAAAKERTPPLAPGSGCSSKSLDF